MKKLILGLYRALFLHRFLGNLNFGLYLIILRGLGILNYENKRLSGEEYLLKKVRKWKSNPLILDVGANEGEYSMLCKQYIPESTVYSFEPHPKTFLRLKQKAEKHKFIPINVALDEASGKVLLFDYTGESGTSHASLYKSVLTDIHSSKADSIETLAWSLDEFIEKNNLQQINLLKIDTEGNEYRVLKGSNRAIKEKKIDIIQFEFSELNIMSRTFMKDFYDLLEGYTFYRLLPNGLLPLGPYHPAKWEIFLFQNIIAVRNNIAL